MKSQEEKKMLDDYYHYDYPYIKPEKSAIDTANDLLAGKCLINLYHTMGLASHTDQSNIQRSMLVKIIIK